MDSFYKHRPLSTQATRPPYPMPKYKTTHVPPPKTPRGCPYARPDTPLTPPRPPARTATRTPPAVTPPMPEPRTDAATPADDAAPPPPSPSPLSLPMPMSPSASDNTSATTAHLPLVVGALAVYTHHEGQEWHVTVLALEGVYAKVRADKGPRMRVPRARLQAVRGAVTGDDGGANQRSRR